jgi:hypothetical protein
LHGAGGEEKAGQKAEKEGQTTSHARDTTNAGVSLQSCLPGVSYVTAMTSELPVPENAANPQARMVLMIIFVVLMILWLLQGVGAFTIPYGGGKWH